MAELVANDISNKEIRVVFNFDNKNKTKIFMPQMCMNLDIKKLKSLGWFCKQNLKMMYKRTILSKMRDI